MLGLTLSAGVCFVAAFYLWVAPHLGAAAAAAVTGAALLIVAAFLALVGRALLRLTKRRPRRLVSELQKAMVLTAKLLLQRDPKKALIVSLLAGALTEFILSPSRKR
jgi:uncharacterized protein (TIGR02265 family)